MVLTDTRENEVRRGSKKIKEDEERRTTKVTRSQKVWFVLQTMYRSPTMHQPRMQINGCDRWRQKREGTRRTPRGRSLQENAAGRGGTGNNSVLADYANANGATRGGTNHLTHPPLSQGAQRRAEGEGRRSRSPLARGDLGGGGILLRGLGRTGAGLDVEVLQDVVVDFRGDLLPLQHLPDGLVGGVGADGRALPRGSLLLQGTKPEL